MKNNKQLPGITIILATYQPPLDYFYQLLKSLNELDYPNLTLLVCDDASDLSVYESIQEAVKKSITAYPCHIERNTTNQKTNKTFARLIREAKTPYVAFCDQDDIWRKDKLKILMNSLLTNKKEMACSDFRVIDQNNNVILNSLKESYKKANVDFHYPNLTKLFVYHNFVFGCTVLIKRELALKALPFIESEFFDRQLAFLAAKENKIFVSDEKLIDHRLHKSNKSGLYKNIKTREQYYQHYILRFKKWIDYLNKKYPNTPEVIDAYNWSNARVACYLKEKGAKERLKESGNDLTKLIDLIELRFLRTWLSFKIFLFLAHRRKI